MAAVEIIENSKQVVINRLFQRVRPPGSMQKDEPDHDGQQPDRQADQGRHQSDPKRDQGDNRADDDENKE